MSAFSDHLVNYFVLVILFHRKGRSKLWLTTELAANFIVPIQKEKKNTATIFFLQCYLQFNSNLRYS